MSEWEIKHLKKVSKKETHFSLSFSLTVYVPLIVSKKGKERERERERKDMSSNGFRGDRSCTLYT